jgi:hypothetical protein
MDLGSNERMPPAALEFTAATETEGREANSKFEAKKGNVQNPKQTENKPSHAEPQRVKR